MKRFSFVFTILFSFFIASLSAQPNAAREPVDEVNPYMGNISHLLVPTFPTVHLPNSMLRVYPERRDFTEITIDGLPLIVTSHRGSSAFNLSTFQGDPKDLKPVITYSYDHEKITPYSYSVYLDEQQTHVDYGVSHQSAVYHFAFNRKEDVYLILNSRNGAMKWDGQAITGYQQLANQTRVYLYLVPESLPTEVQVLTASGLANGTAAEGRNAAVVLRFPASTRELTLRYGISFIETSQAKRNMDREVSGKSLAEVQKTGRDIWNEALGRIDIDGGSENERTVFYTSLYRTYERPVNISEDGRYYSAFDHQVHEDNGRPFYTDDWIWDSYRAHHPLRILVDATRESDILNSFVRMSEQMDQLWWPTFPEITGDSRRMNSNHGVASVIDAHRKGVGGFDLEKAYLACKGAITEKTLAPWSGKPAGELDRFYQEHGYIPALHEGEEETIPEVHSFERRQPVAVTLGTAYDEWCLAQLASDLGKVQDAGYFMKKSFNYVNLFNPETKFFHPKDKQGNFIQPFDYKFSGGMGAREYYGENNAWVYRWDVQHNIPHLIELMGGKEAFVHELDAMFMEPLGRSKYAFYAQLPDHTGNVGQFSMANEPSLHIPYLYNYAGQPWKTQKRIRKLLDEWFRNDLMGVPGDEDGGGMTAFVVFSQMGFYPVTPGNPVYAIGSPVFAKATVKVSQSPGKTFTVKATNYAPENKYVQSARLNGKELDGPWISHDQIVEGGTLELEMGQFPNLDWGK